MPDDEIAPLEAYLTLNISDFSANLEKAKAQGKEFADSSFGARASLNIQDVEANASRAKEQLRQLDSRHQATATLSTTDLTAKADEAKAKLDEIDAKHPEAKVGADIGDVEAKVAEADVILDTWGKKVETATLNVDNRPAMARLAEAAAAFDAEKASFEAGALGVGSPTPGEGFPMPPWLGGFQPIASPTPEQWLSAVSSVTAPGGYGAPFLPVESNALADITNRLPVPSPAASSFPRLPVGSGELPFVPSEAAIAPPPGWAMPAASQLPVSSTPGSMQMSTVQARAELNRLQADLQRLSAQRANPKVALDDIAASAKLDEINERLDTLSHSRSVRLDVESAAGMARIDAMKANLDSLILKEEEVKAASGGGSSGGGGGLFGGDGGNFLGIPGLSTLGRPGLSPIVAGLAAVAPAAIASIGPLVAGAGSAFGALYGSISGVIPAIQAYSQAQQQAGQNAIQKALQTIQANQQLKQSVESVANAATAYAQAQEQASFTIQQASQAASNAQVTGTYQVQQAEQALTNERMNAADSVRSATQQLQQAEIQYTDSVWSEQQAQQALITARMQAQFQLQDYSNQLKDAALTQQQDYLAVQQAQETLNQTLADPSATRLQRQEAELAYNQAVQAVQDQATQYAQLRTEAAITSHQGVQGQTAVVQALHAVVTAEQQVRQSQQQVHDDRISLSQADYNAIVGLKDAIKALSMAEYQRAFSSTQAEQSLSQARLTANQQIRAAHIALIDARQAEADANRVALLTSKELQGSAATLKSALEGLSPAAQNFVKWFDTGPYKDFHKFSAEMGTTLLPLLKLGLIDFGHVMHDLEPIFKGAATGMGTWFDQMEKWASHGGLKGILTLFAEGNKVFSAFGDVMTIFVKDIVQMGPEGTQVLLALAHGLEVMLISMGKWANSKLGHDYFTGFANTLKAAGPAMAQFFKTLFDIIPQLLPLLPPLLKLINELLTTIDKFVTGPHFEKNLSHFVTQISDLVKGLAHMFEDINHMKNLAPRTGSHAPGWAQGIVHGAGDLFGWLFPSEPKPSRNDTSKPGPQGLPGPGSGKESALGGWDILDAIAGPNDAQTLTGRLADIKTSITAAQPDIYTKATQLGNSISMGILEGLDMTSTTARLMSDLMRMTTTARTVGHDVGMAFDQGMIAGLRADDARIWQAAHGAGAAAHRGIIAGAEGGRHGDNITLHLNVHVDGYVGNNHELATVIGEVARNHMAKVGQRNGSALGIRGGVRSGRTRGT